MKDVVLLVVSVYLLKQMLEKCQQGELELADDNPYQDLDPIRPLGKRVRLPLLRASMAIVFLFFGYTKWFNTGRSSGPLYQPRPVSSSGCTPFSGFAGPLGF